MGSSQICIGVDELPGNGGQGGNANGPDGPISAMGGGGSAICWGCTPARVAGGPRGTMASGGLNLGTIA